jgi:hypothetical protein
VTVTRRVRAAALVLAAALALAACDPDEVGAAAVVGDERISVDDLHGEVLAFAETAPDVDVSGDTTTLQQAVLERMVRHELVVLLAEREGVEVTEGDIDRFLEGFVEQQGGDITAFLAQNGFTEESVREAVYDELAVQQLTAELGSQDAVFEALNEVVADVGVEVNPRYGEWNGSALERRSGSISEPVGGETAAPQG